MILPPTLSSMRQGRAAALAFVVITLIAAEAMGDRRIFARSYPYMTLPAGGFEIEHYLDVGLKRVDDPDTKRIESKFMPSWTTQVEFEYGITDRLDFGFYSVFRQKAFEDFKFRGVKLRSRYRFLDEGVLPVDPAVYVEFAYYGDEVKFEQILIVARRFGKLESSVNFKFEEKIKYGGPETEFVFEFIPSIGIGYHFNNNVSLALEYYGKLEVEDGETEDFDSYLGPTISVAGRHFFWTVLLATKLNGIEDSAECQVRSLFGSQL